MGPGQSWLDWRGVARDWIFQALPCWYWLVPDWLVPDWGVPAGVGIGVEVDEEKVGVYHEQYLSRGQFVPYDPKLIGSRMYR